MSGSFGPVIRIKLPSLFRHASMMGGCDPRAMKLVEPAREGCMFTPKGDVVDEIMEASADRLGMEPDKVKPRVMRITITKQAGYVPTMLANSTSDVPAMDGLDPFYSNIADIYAHYVVKAATLMTEDKDNNLLPNLIIAQNLQTV